MAQGAAHYWESSSVTTPTAYGQQRHVRVIVMEPVQQTEAAIDL